MSGEGVNLFFFHVVSITIIMWYLFTLLLHSPKSVIPGWRRSCAWFVHRCCPSTVRWPQCQRCWWARPPCPISLPPPWPIRSPGSVRLRWSYKSRLPCPHPSGCRWSRPPSPWRLQRLYPRTPLLHPPWPADSSSPDQVLCRRPSPGGARFNTFVNRFSYEIFKITVKSMYVDSRYTINFNGYEFFVKLTKLLMRLSRQNLNGCTC